MDVALPLFATVPEFVAVLLRNDVILIVLLVVPVIFEELVVDEDGFLEFVDVLETSDVPVTVLEIGGVFEPAIV